MKTMKLLTLVSLLFAGHAFSMHQVVKENGKPLEVRWEDGRIARYAVTSSPVFQGDLPLQLSENTCSNNPATNCFLRGYLKVVMPVIYWEKHSNPDRIGKVVKGNIVGVPDFQIHFPYFLNIDQRIQKNALALSLPTDEIHCGDFAWLPEISGTPEKLTIPRWNVESMVQNPETGLNENRVIGGGIGVELHKTGTNSLGIVSASSLFGPNKTLVQGDIMAWILRLSNGEHCQISIKANVASFNSQVLALYYDTLEKFKPSSEYLWGSDLFSNEYFPGYFNGFLSDPEVYKPL